MTPQAGGMLAKAVSDAGAFGMLGFDEDESEHAIGSQLALVAANKATVFGIGLVAWVLEKRSALLDLAINARPKLISVSFGDISPYVERIHAAGILIASQVQSRETARRALDAGVDVLIAQGAEAGGHTGIVGTLPLLQLILEMTGKPVVAAGGIATGRGFAAVLAAGAAGAWVGTPFLLATESRTARKAQSVLIAADETQTVYTSVFDRVQAKGWTSEFRGRSLKNAFADRWDGHEEELLRTPAAIAEFEDARKTSDYSKAHIYAGQSVGVLNRTSSAAEIVARLEREAILRLQASKCLLYET